MNKIRKWKKITRRFFDKGVCPYQLSFILDSIVRKLILSPKELANRLHFKEDSKVLELGCGSGYFSVEIAKRLPKGYLELFDLQKEMLEKARRKIEAKGLTNVGYTQGDAINLPFGDNRFDAVFLVAVLGEVTEPEKCLKEIDRVLKLEGLLSITEQPGDPDFVALETVKKLAEKQGFKFVEKFGKKKNFTVNFRKEK